MNLYLLKQDFNAGYNMHDSMVVAAKDREEAVQMHPDAKGAWGHRDSTWAFTPEQVTCTLLGEATKDVLPCIILKSFNAG